MEYSFSSRKHEIEVAYHKRLTVILKVIRFLLLQGLPFGGHDESLTSSNRVETTNAILADLGDRWFTLLLDEARDCPVKEQMTVVIRYVYKHGEVIERFMVVVHVATTTAACLKEAINSLFAKYVVVAIAQANQYVCDFMWIVGSVVNTSASSCKRAEFDNLNMIESLNFLKEERLVLVIDIILHKMDNRFSEITTDLLIYMSCLDPRNSFSRFDVQKLVCLIHFYEDDFSWNERILVEQELETYTDDVRSDERFEGISDLGALTKKMIETMKNRVFPLVYRMIELALLLPVATATVERVFSAMNIVKIDLRNRIGDELMNASLEKKNSQTESAIELTLLKCQLLNR
ncbi:uncharacterized protein LOC122034083 [Zingiber officinale]|uniref:uncharacterized protein LOC122034083 n=1 Tax=Zingiber officinale TaxID=94328 RepID=UPI001C4D7DE9|nr:uncharacterized protein LOC122034083 [Zingiber officinale]